MGDRHRAALLRCAARLGCVALVGLVAVACGDDLVDPGPPLAPADTLVIVAHLDDDMIFMQPQLASALAHGSLTTIYVLSGDPVRGAARAQRTFEASMMAYQHAAGARRWDCGYVTVAELPVHHCRLRDRPVSMIGLDLPDGGRNDERAESLLHLVEQRVPSLPLLGPQGGRITADGLITALAALVTVTAPRELHTLDLAATHGDDHPGHLMVASFALWAAARASFAGALVSHRGYNVAGEPETLGDADYAFARPMLGYFEACYQGCAPCGQQCATLDASHEVWLRRQYATTSLAIAAGRLASADATAACLAVRDGALRSVDCADAGVLRLTPDRHLRVGDRCASSAEDNEAALSLRPCAEEPAQYWRIDGEGLVVNGRPPLGGADMRFDHVRCLHAGANAAAAPICGRRLSPRWQLLP